jgi:hypothetical protein
VTDNDARRIHDLVRRGLTGGRPMSGPEFFQTRMGQQFYDGTMRRLVTAAESIAASLEQLAAAPAPNPADDAGKVRVRLVPDAVAGLFGECVELLHDHDTAWDNEEESVKEEHAELIQRTRALLARLAGGVILTPPLNFDQGEDQR